MRCILFRSKIFVRDTPSDARTRIGVEVFARYIEQGTNYFTIHIFTVDGIPLSMTLSFVHLRFSYRL